MNQRELSKWVRVSFDGHGFLFEVRDTTRKSFGCGTALHIPTQAAEEIAEWVEYLIAEDMLGGHVEGNDVTPTVRANITERDGLRIAQRTDPDKRWGNAGEIVLEEPEAEEFVTFVNEQTSE